MSREALHNLLKDNTAIAAVVSERLHYSYLPEGDFGPSIVIGRGNDNRELIHKKSAGLVKGFAPINCFAPTPMEAEDLADLVRLALDGFNGSVNIEGGAVGFNYIQIEDQGEIPISPSDASDKSPVHGIRSDARYAYRETAPNLIGA